nr:hypothetical protein [Candidatus Gracilibacteria bacterium]
MSKLSTRMKSFKKIISLGLVYSIIFGLINPFFSIFNQSVSAFDSSFTTNLVQANVLSGADLTQSATTVITVPNVVGVYASGASTTTDGSYVTANNVGASSNGINIVITDTNNAGPNCASATLGGTSPNYTIACDLDASSLTAILGGWTKLSATMLTNIINTASDIHATVKGTGGNTVTAHTITLTGGVTPVAQVNTITIGGGIDAGDIYTANLPLGVNTSYTATGTDTLSTIASGLNSSIQTSSGYVSQAFTSISSGSTVVLTAKVPGTGFTQTSSATNFPGVAQVVDFIPTVPTEGETLSGTINSTHFQYTIGNGETVSTVITSLLPLMNAQSNVTCVNNTTKITCTANVPGVLFTYSSEVVDITSPVFQTLSVTSNNSVSGSYAKAGDNLSFTLNISPADTSKTGNNIGFSIGTLTGLTTSLSSSTARITQSTGTYTVLSGQNGVITLNSLTFLDQSNNTITGVVLPSINITIDTTNPVITITDDASVTPVQSDTIVASLTEINPNTFEYGY